MFHIDISVNLGKLGLRDGSAWAVIDESTEPQDSGYLISHFNVLLHLGSLGDHDVTSELAEDELDFIKRRLIYRYEAAKARNEITPEDWNRLEPA